MVYDTYMHEMRCPHCGHDTLVVIQDTQGERLMRVLRPHDVVAEFKSDPFREIENEAECDECHETFEVHIPIIYGIIGHFSSDRFIPDMDPEDLIEYLRQSCVASYELRQRLQRRADVASMICRFWTTSREGGEIPAEWHVSEDDLPVIGADTPAGDVIRAMAKYLGDQ